MVLPLMTWYSFEECYSEKRPKLLTKRWFPLHDNAQPHIAHVAMETLADIGGTRTLQSRPCPMWFGHFQHLIWAARIEIEHWHWSERAGLHVCLCASKSVRERERAPGENWTTLRKTCPIVAMSTTNPTFTNLSLHGERHSANHLSHRAAWTQINFSLLKDTYVLYSVSTQNA
jgi:hypothetical protein